MSSVQLLPATATPSISTAKATPFKNLQSCSTMPELKQHHAHIIKLGLSSDNDAMGRVIKFCALSESGDLNHALKVFASLPHPDAFIYNTMFRGYLEARLYRNCIVLYAHMLEKFVTPNKFSFPPVIRACCVDNAVEEAKQVHAHVIKLGFSQDSFCQNNLIHMYVNFESLEEAKRVFDSLDKKDDVSWTTLISGSNGVLHVGSPPYLKKSFNQSTSVLAENCSLIKPTLNRKTKAILRFYFEFCLVSMSMANHSVSDEDYKSTKPEFRSVANEEREEASPPEVSIQIPSAKTSGGSQVQRRRIYKVPPTLHANKEHIYDLVVLSLGRYHHGRPQFREVEEFKTEILNRFLLDSATKDKGFFCNKILERIDEIRSYYEEGSTDEFSDKALAEMILRDACFILYYMKVEDDSEYHPLGMSVILFMYRDFFMLENQIPLWIIRLLIGLKYNKHEEEALFCKFLSSMNFGEDRLTKIP
ncbi:Pentatricopeptide repeat-containing protein [Sesamum alatum]|uniref:Pentatricopeptide repeat-containing protein n=1 Tax=Sesamum alatum TaxID=300844 RepID=A0AAE1YL98_9LAMI|nr:Pentatricopeptide repeat-containing protein [Sesamum alatum]